MSIPQKSRQYLLPAGRKEGYKNLTITEVEAPKLKANDVLVKVHAASLQYRDLAIANEFYGGLNGREIVPGSDMSGEVIAVGQDVTGFPAGDRACANSSPAHLCGDPTAATMISFKVPTYLFSDSRPVPTTIFIPFGSLVRDRTIVAKRVQPCIRTTDEGLRDELEAVVVVFEVIRYTVVSVRPNIKSAMVMGHWPTRELEVFTVVGADAAETVENMIKRQSERPAFLSQTDIAPGHQPIPRPIFIERQEGMIQS
ncbi:hypothetical protein D9611_009618 [Ephemerocybe angulata]|uniref:Alcohol dehydrogenase-like N-terminal domain-containing protein n=1 Tax=Ephemerocybe angulata TaxID=980116 RepID=A0A8H5C644_9AGAR|nr:hypothetical protein D9611_009618 [Tulosesus angulatus]